MIPDQYYKYFIIANTINGICKFVIQRLTVLVAMSRIPQIYTNIVRGGTGQLSGSSLLLNNLRSDFRYLVAYLRGVEDVYLIVSDPEYTLD